MPEIVKLVNLTVKWFGNIGC